MPVDRANARAEVSLSVDASPGRVEVRDGKGNLQLMSSPAIRLCRLTRNHTLRVMQRITSRLVSCRHQSRSLIHGRRGSGTRRQDSPRRSCEDLPGFVVPGMSAARYSRPTTTISNVSGFIFERPPAAVSSCAVGRKMRFVSAFRPIVLAPSAVFSDCCTSNSPAFSPITVSDPSRQLANAWPLSTLVHRPPLQWEERLEHFQFACP